MKTRDMMILFGALLLAGGLYLNYRKRHGFSGIRYADVKDPEPERIRETPTTSEPYPMGSKRKALGPALSKWRCVGPELPRSLWKASKLVMVTDRSKASKEVSCSADACEVLQPLRSAHREEMHVLALDTRSRIIGSALVAAGSTREMLIDPAEVFKPALLMNANRVILAHNHPSGDPTPSPEDVALTRRVQAVGTALGVNVLDHVVVGDPHCRSLRDLGLMERA